MATNPYWRPIQKGAPLAYELKYIFNQCGFFRNSSVDTLNFDHITTLKAIESASTIPEVRENCNTLIDMINKTGAVEIYLE